MVLVTIKIPSTGRDNLDTNLPSLCLKSFNFYKCHRVNVNLYPAPLPCDTNTHFFPLAVVQQKKLPPNVDVLSIR